jgi:hypothetical protein
VENKGKKKAINRKSGYWQLHLKRKMPERANINYGKYWASNPRNMKMKTPFFYLAYLISLATCFLSFRLATFLPHCDWFLLGNGFWKSWYSGESES